MRRAIALVAGLLLAVLAPSHLHALAQEEVLELRIESVDTSSHPQVQFAVVVPAQQDATLPSSALTLLENGEQREARLTHESSATTDIHIVLLIDTTGSMSGGPLAGAQAAAKAFLDEVDDSVHVAVHSYDVETTPVTDFSASRSEHVAGIDGLRANGYTAMFDAVRSTVDAFPEIGGPARRVIILLTDGEDNSSISTLEEAIESVVDAEVTLHGIEYLTAFTDEAAIREMAEATGGGVFRADDAATLTEIYRQLAVDLSSRYHVTYVSESSGRTELVAEIDHAGLRARGTRTVVLPVTSPPDDAHEEGEELASPVPPVVRPAVDSTFGPLALVGGAGLWFAALVIAASMLLAPARRHVQFRTSMTGSRRSRFAGRAGLLTERALERRGYRTGLNAALERAGIDVRPGEFVVLVGSIAFTAAAVGHLLQGWIVGLVFGLLTPAAFRVAVSMRTSRRQARFADQLGRTLQLLAGSLRAGYSLLQAVDAVARDSDAPTSQEFSRLVVETRLGREMNDTLAAMADRMQSDDFRWVVQAILINQEVGGDLAEVLDTVAETIRERDQVRRQFRTLSAEGRLSMYILAAMPFGVAAVMYFANPGYLAELTHGGPLGWGLLSAGGLLMLVGMIWMRHIVRLRF